jgi:hypothetical protein
MLCCINHQYLWKCEQHSHFAITQLMDVTISPNYILSHYVGQQIPEIGTESNITLATHVTILCNSFATPRRGNFIFTRVAL